MRVAEGCTHGSQTIDIRGLSLWVATQVAHPVVQVVNGNEENIGTIVGRDDASGQGSKKKVQEQSFHGEFFSKWWSRSFTAR